MEQRSISWGELNELQVLFDEQVISQGIIFPDDEIRDEALFDFVDQYINGCDYPEVNCYF